MTTPATPPTPPPANPTPSTPPPAPPASTVTVDQAATAVETVVSDLHRTAADFQSEWAAASQKTKDDLATLLRDASIARGEAFTALRKLIGA
jgi:hypothetical protein